MRLSDAAAVITSFALLVVLHTIMLHWSEATNGPRTLFGLPQATDLPRGRRRRGAIVLAVLFTNRAPACCCARPRRRDRGRRARRRHPQLRWRASC